MGCTAGDALGYLVEFQYADVGYLAAWAVAIALYCALRHADSFEDAVIAAVNHDGDSDSTGAVTGNIMGALLGMEGIPAAFVQPLELRDVLLATAKKLAE